MADRPVDDLEVRRKRLRFRSWHRGSKEMDMLLGTFADRALASLSPQQLDRYEALLQTGDPELYGWITGRDAVPEAHDHDVMRLLQNFNIRT
jgi:antitoxin CptB